LFVLGKQSKGGNMAASAHARTCTHTHTTHTLTPSHIYIHALGSILRAPVHTYCPRWCPRLGAEIHCAQQLGSARSTGPCWASGGMPCGSCIHTGKRDGIAIMAHDSFSLAWAQLVGRRCLAGSFQLSKGIFKVLTSDPSHPLLLLHPFKYRSMSSRCSGAWGPGPTMRSCL